jgi:hypothetical protein
VDNFVDNTRNKCPEAAPVLAGNSLMTDWAVKKSMKSMIFYENADDGAIYFGTFLTCSNCGAIPWAAVQHKLRTEK